MSRSTALPHAVALRLRALRQSRGLSQTEVGAPVGMSREQVYQYESGRRGITPSAAARLARSLGVDLAEVLDG